MKKMNHILNKKFVIYAKKNFFLILTAVKVCTGKYRGAAQNICNLRYKTPKEIPVVFHNGSVYVCFINKELAKKFDGQFECFGQNTDKYFTFSVPIKKQLGNGKTTT